MPLPLLSLLETRVLGVLVEKERTVPDAYPLTLNALTAGCNQKSSRDPVIDASETDVQAAIDRLKSLSLVVETSGGRVMRFAHNMGRVFQLPPQSVALLAVLFLRGAQTPGELRIHSERLHKFGDLLSVQAFLEELAERKDGALVRELARQPGARENRWTHLVSGEPAIEASAASASVPAAEPLARSDIAVLQAQVKELQAQVASLTGIVERLSRELGIPFP
ncbi:MAG: YceH family protein [Bacillota bacterium]